jgi:hypothetical protein
MGCSMNYINIRTGLLIIIVFDAIRAYLGDVYSIIPGIVAFLCLRKLINDKIHGIPE